MCELCKLEPIHPQFILTICKTCNVPMIVSREHKPEFSSQEKEVLSSIFKNIRWNMRSIKDHAHCHLIDKTE